MLSLEPLPRGDMVGRWCALPERRAPTSVHTHLHFHCAQGFATRTLAYMLDSLVRVSRRDGDTHLARASTALEPQRNKTPHKAALQAVLPSFECLSRSSLPNGARFMPRSRPRNKPDHTDLGGQPRTQPALTRPLGKELLTPIQTSRLDATDSLSAISGTV